MYGFVVRSLERLVAARGADAWSVLQARASYVREKYDDDADYDDDEVVKLILTYADLSGKPVPRALEALGRWFAKELIAHFRKDVDPEWRTLDFLLNAEPKLHDIVRARTKIKKPPLLRVRRTGPHQVNVIYDASPLLGEVAVGMVRGVADYYREDVDVEALATIAGGEPADVYRVKCSPRQSVLKTEETPDPFAALVRTHEAARPVEAPAADAAAEAEAAAAAEAAKRANRAPPKGRGPRSLK